ncbi:hypothetical protein Tco_1359843 [Tanacetum coccineum]
MNSNTASTSGSGILPSNNITNPKVDLKGITTRSGVAYQGPTIPTTTSSPPKVVERKTEVTKDMVPLTNNGSTKDVQPLVVQIQPQVPNSEPVVAPNSSFELTGFSDVDYAGCKDTFNSTSDGAQFLGEKLVSWSLKKQDCTALSTVES